jgi:hypothetical protein
VPIQGGVFVKGAQIEKKLLQGLMPKKHVPPKVFPNCLLKNAISAP